jgi:tRNA nucleotidyltransferase (CCA-adding enzyme)
MKVFDKVEGKRLLNEVIHTLDEKNPVPGLDLLQEMGVIQALHPALEFSVRTRGLVESVMGVLAWWRYLFLDEKLEQWTVYFLAITDNLTDEDFHSALARFSVPKNRAKALTEERVQARIALAKFARSEVEKPSEVANLLRHFSLEALLFMMARTSRDKTRKQISEFITGLRHLRPLIRGRDLMEMGFTPGPVFSAILTHVRDARLDGSVVTREDEINLVKSRFQPSVERED